MRKIGSILVATDLTEASDEVLRAAAALAALTDAKLHVLHAFDFQSFPYSEECLDRVTFEDSLADARCTLEGQLRRTVRPEVEVGSREVAIHAAHRAIRERAEAVAADLIVLGPHRRHAVGDRFLGSTADRVIRTAEAPCLIVRGPLSLPLRRVLVPVDLSGPALGALDVALAWGHALGPLEEDGARDSRVVVLHVVPPAFASDDFPFDRTVIGPRLRREVEAALARVSAARSLDVREEVCRGEAPAEEILRVADRETADLVVLATHGHGAVKRALIGSVASAVARAARGPVLLVPPALWNAEEPGSPRASSGDAFPEFR